MTSPSSSEDLGAGIKMQDVADAVTRSGYPLQWKVASDLASRFSITEEWGYIDRDSKERRALDVVAVKEIPPGRIEPYFLSTTLLIECKRTDTPYVFFSAANSKLPRDFPRVPGLAPNGVRVHGAKGGLKILGGAEFLKLEDFDFISKGPRVCRAFARVERPGKELRLSGEIPFREVVLPLISAHAHWEESILSTPSSPSSVFPYVTVMLCVLDGPMINVVGASSPPTLEKTSWVRLVRQESRHDGEKPEFEEFVIDVVAASFLSEYVDRHFVPFAQSLHPRMKVAFLAVANGKVTVPDSNSWTWKDLIP